MLTAEKLLILLRYNWDEVRFRPTSSAADKPLLASIDWKEYASLRQDLLLVSKKLISPEYARPGHRQLLAACADEATARTFIGYASTL